MTLFERIWAFLSDPANRVVLAWLGGGLVVGLGGVWTVFTYFRPSSTANKARSDPRKVTAEHSSVAIGRDNKGGDFAAKCDRVRCHLTRLGEGRRAGAGRLRSGCGSRGNGAVLR